MLSKVSEMDGVLAQLVEQRTFNPFVVGSIPAHPTNKIKELRLFRSSFLIFSSPIVARKHLVIWCLANTANMVAFLQ